MGAKKAVVADNSQYLEKTSLINLRAEPNDPKKSVQLPPCLVLVEGPTDQLGQQWVVEDDRVLIGRVPSATIQFGETNLSKEHAYFDKKDNEVIVVDLASTNGTFLEGQRLEANKPYKIKNNQQVKMGSLVFKFLERGILSETSEKERMQSELETAAAIQNSLFPAGEENINNWIRIAGRYRSASECAGDWWWRWQTKQHAFALIGDTTGHGAAAALVTSAARAAVASLESESEAVKIEKVYSVLSGAIRACSGGNMAMSAFIVEIDLQNRQMRFVNASHLPAVILPKHAHSLKWNQLDYLVVPLSPQLGDTRHEIVVGSRVTPANTRLVLLTDGLTERIDSEGRTLTEREFNSMLIDVHLTHRRSPTEFLDGIIKYSDERSKSAPLADDITVVAIDFA